MLNLQQIFSAIYKSIRNRGRNEVETWETKNMTNTVLNLFTSAKAKVRGPGGHFL